MHHLLPLLLLAPAAPAPQAPFVVSLGALECEFTRSHLDAVKWRDRYVVGDAFENPRPAAQILLLREGWKTLAKPEEDDASDPVVRRTAEEVRVTLQGRMREAEEGAGRWEWRQEWTHSRAGVLRLDYQVRQTAAPTQRWWLHRFSLIGNREELFVTYPNRDQHTPGKPVRIVTREGKTLSPRFGSPEGTVANPAEVFLPYAGREIPIRADAQARRVELWNAWWRQATNFEIPTGPEVRAHFEVDLSQLPQVPDPELAVAGLPREPQPWLTGATPPLPPTARPLRFAQNTPSIIAWGDVRTHPEAELERFFTEMAKHFDVMELTVSWTDWKWDLGWDRDPKARAHAEAVAAEVKKQVRIAHAHGIRIALSLNFGESGPGTGKLETRRQPRLQGETLDPEKGAFTPNPDCYDWASPEAVASARRAWEDCARLVGPVDYLFFNEPHWRLDPWYAVPLFSEAALADFRRFTGDPRARFPAKPYCAETPRTNRHADPAEWARWYDWAQECFARMIRTQAEAFAAANAGSPDYSGAIYFQHVGWTGPLHAVDLDRVAAIPQVTWLCAEYVTDAAAPGWRKFRHYAARHGRKLSSFANIGWYDPDAPGRVRYEGADAAFEAAVRMGVVENAPMITLYPATSLDSASPGYHAARTAIWDRLTRPGR